MFNLICLLRKIYYTVSKLLQTAHLRLTSKFFFVNMLNLFKIIKSLD